jgi:sugar lactone lactonase YvrE
MGPFRCIADLSADLLEGPVWDDRRGVLFVCDIPGCGIIEIDLAEGPKRRWIFDQQVTALGLCESGSLVVALARKVIVFGPDSGDQSDLWTGYDELPTSRLNDGKVGPDGAFWVGSMDGRPQREAIAKLYRIDSAGTAQVTAEGIEVSNGLAWSPDSRIMYHSDSRGPWIDSYDFDSTTGSASKRTRICDLTEAVGRPDGAACDASGDYWSAGVSAGVLNRFASDGRLLAAYPFPAPAPTMPCFCGPGLEQIAVTTHRLLDDARLQSAPQSGGVFLADAPVAGAPVTRMKGI